MQRIPRFDPQIVRGTIITPYVPTIVRLLWVIAISDRLPEQMATHWNGGDMPDSLMSPVQNASVMAIIVIACAQISWFGARTRTPLVVCKPIAITNLALCGFLIDVEFAIIIPQIDTTDPTAAQIGWIYTIAGVIIGLVAALFVTRHLKDYSSSTDAMIAESTSPCLPHREGDPTPIDVDIAISKSIKITLAVWCVVFATLSVFLPSPGIIFLLCAPLFLVVYETSMTLDTDPNTDSITVFSGYGPLKTKHRIELRTVKYAKPATYSWANGGDIGLRLGNDGRIIVTARSGETVKIETSGSNYTIIVPDGMTAAVADEVNNRTDAIYQQAVY